jgi:hypothetical protein
VEITEETLTQLMALKEKVKIMPEQKALFDMNLD